MIECHRGESDLPAELRRCLSICIVAHNAYGAIHGGETGFIGGIEWQTSLFARWLAIRGHKVSLLTWDEGNPNEEYVHGVRVLKICRAVSGIRGLRFFHPKWTGLIAALRKAQAEIYYHNGAENVTGQIALWCRMHAKGFVFSSANDTDCDKRLPELRHLYDRKLYLYGLRAADRVIVQTKTQQSMMQSNFQVSSQIIRMPCPRPKQPQAPRLHPVSNRVLWIGRVCLQKRPDRLVELAEALPELQFDLVGPHLLRDRVSENAIARAIVLQNVCIHGRVSPDQMAQFYSDAACLVSTSDYEGFPNTFLEAWSYGLPIVSTFDPDGLITRMRMGAVAGDVEGLAREMRRLLSSEVLYGEASQNALSYYLENHVASRVLPQFEQLLLGVVASKGLHLETA